MSEYVTDTHPLIWYVTGNKALSKTAKDIFTGKSNIIHVPIIVLVETKYLFRKGKISCDGSDLRSDIECFPNWHIHDFTRELLEFCSFKLSIHDAMICAFAFKNNLPVITKDSNIVNNQHIKSIW